MARGWVDVPRFLSHLIQKCFNAGLVPFHASNLNIKPFWLCCIITTFHPVSCVTRLSSPSCVGWMKGPAVRMLLGWRGASTDNCCGCGNDFLVGCSVKKFVGTYMKEQESLPKQVQRIFQVEGAVLLPNPLWVSLAVDVLTSQLTCLSTCSKQDGYKQLERPLIIALSQLAISPSWPLRYSHWRWQTTQLWRPGAKGYGREWSAFPWSGEASKKEENHQHI